MVTKKDKYLAAAQKYLERGSLEKALVELQGAVKEDAKDTRTWLRMAEVHVRLGQNDKATEVYQKTVDLYVEQGFFQRAVAVYKNIIKLSPESIGARIKLADVYRQLGLFSDAIQQLEQAVALHQRAGDISQALSALKQVIELNPEHAPTRIRYAELAVQAGQNDEAVAEFREAANLLKTQGRSDEFARVAERILYYQPDDFALGTELARIYLDRNNARAALTRLKPAFEANQSDPEVLDLLARSFEQLGQPNKSLPVLKELCRVYANSGRMSERNQTIQRALALDPNDAELRAMLGRVGTDTARGAPVVPLHRMPTLPGPSPAVQVPAFAPAQVPRSTAITFSEMEVPEALQNRYKTPSADVPPSPVDRVAIASGMVEKTDDDAEIKRILAEADTFVKYGLVERAAEHLRRVFDRVPTHTGAHERLAAVLVQLGRKSEAAAEMEVLAQQLLPVSRAEAADYARRALGLNPNAKRAADVLATIGGKVSSTGSHAAAPTEKATTPEPEAMIESGEIELLGDGLAAGDEEVGTGAVAELAAAFGSAKVEDAELADGFGEDRTPSSPMSISEADEPEVSIVKSTTQPASAASLTPVPDGRDAEIDAILDGGTIGKPAGASLAAPMDEADSEAMLSDLEQVDFFIEQELGDDARALLDELEARHPGHMLVADRRERLRKIRRGPARRAPQPLSVETPTPAPNLPSAVEPLAQAAKGAGPTKDLDTEADLGVMNKTMERHDLAIQHFTSLLGDPKREVFALTMIGESQEALGNLAEAIRCYQDALRRPRATEEEATQLYFLLGNVFYNKGDRAEALYYFERVSKRDPSFRDVQRRLAALKSRGNPH